MSEICSVCKTQINKGDHVIACMGCSISYHEECWTDNRGCATYGCKHVGILNKPIQVPHVTASSYPPEELRPSVWHCAIGSEMHGPWNTGQVRRWVVDHNAWAVAKVWQSGWPQWRPITDSAEFRDRAGVAPPPPKVPPSNVGPLFLHVSIARLIVMSIVSFGVYEAYWIYKNWQYIKERDHLSISPFWRGWFGIFYCHKLLRRIHEDEEARSVEVPAFSAEGLATGWVILTIMSIGISRVPGVAATMLSVFIPSFLFLVPVQNYVNRVSQKRTPGQPYYGWSSGHIVCIVLGSLIWVLLLAGLGAEN